MAVIVSTWLSFDGLVTLVEGAGLSCFQTSPPNLRNSSYKSSHNPHRARWNRKSCRRREHGEDLDPFNVFLLHPNQCSSLHRVGPWRAHSISADRLLGHLLVNSLDIFNPATLVVAFTMAATAKAPDSRSESSADLAESNLQVLVTPWTGATGPSLIFVRISLAMPEALTRLKSVFFYLTHTLSLFSWQKPPNMRFVRHKSRA